MAYDSYGQGYYCQATYYTTPPPRDQSRTAASRTKALHPYQLTHCSEIIQHRLPSCTSRRSSISKFRDNSPVDQMGAREGNVEVSKGVILRLRSSRPNNRYGSILPNFPCFNIGLALDLSFCFCGDSHQSLGQRARMHSGRISPRCFRQNGTISFRDAACALLYKPRCCSIR